MSALRGLTDGDVEMLKAHIHALAQVEFFTIPFYLTAVYSFTDAALQYSEKDSQGQDTYPLSDLQQKTLSVAVQEMYHLQGAFNLSNAFDVPIELEQSLRSFVAGQTLTVPHLEPGQQPLNTRLGNLPQVIEALIEVERPDEGKTGYPPPNPEVVYPSIGDLYHATLVLLEKYLVAAEGTPGRLDPHFLPGHLQVAYPTFQTRYRFNEIDHRDDVTGVANAIADQGEGREVVPAGSRRFVSGAQGGGDPSVDCAVHAQFQPAPGSRFAAYDDITHFCRFEAIEQSLDDNDWPRKVGAAVFYTGDGQVSSDLPSWAEGFTLEDVQAQMNTLWSYLVDLMLRGFRTGRLTDSSGGGVSFGSVMTGFKYLVPMVWQLGGCPSWVYRHGVTEAEAAAAMDAIDPLCLFHWDQRTAQVRANHPDQKNACQGLNSCQGLGWGGIATEKGDGACATADFHTCGGGNACTGQGGCGFLSTEPSDTQTYLPCSEQWIPGQNTGELTGGCQTPIGTEQVFNRNVEVPPSLADCAKIPTLKATPVWDEARKILAGSGTLPTPRSETIGDIDYDGSKRRAAVAPTSK